MFYKIGSEKIFKLEHNFNNNSTGNVKKNNKNFLSASLFVPKSIHIIYIPEENIFIGVNKNHQLWAFDIQSEEIKFSDFKVFFTQITDKNYELLHSDKVIKRYKNSIIFKDNSDSVIYIQKIDFENFEELGNENVKEEDIDVNSSSYQRYKINEVEIQVQDMTIIEEDSGAFLCTITLKGNLTVQRLQKNNNKKLKSFSITKKVSNSIKAFNHTLAISPIKNGSSSYLLISSIANGLPYIQLFSVDLKDKSIVIVSRYSFLFEGLKSGYESCFNKISSDIFINGFPVIALIQGASGNKKLFIFSILGGDLVLVSRSKLPNYVFHDYRSDGRRGIVMIDQYLTAIKVGFN